MSAMRKMGVYLGLLEDAEGEYADVEPPYGEAQYDEPARRDEGRTEAIRRPPSTGRNGQQASNYHH